MTLAEIIPAYADWLSAPPQRTSFHSVKGLNQKINKWEKKGAEVVTLGYSSAGAEIRAAVIGSGQRTLLAWGYPHPDEPLGAEALVWLGDGLVGGKIDIVGWRVVLILCPDPDQVAFQRFLKDPKITCESFARGCWRPETLGREVDYGFPMEWQDFYWPKDSLGSNRPDEGLRGDEGPYPPLAESLALASGIDRFQPDLVASMHSTHTGGDYTFLLKSAGDDFLNKMRLIPEAAGTVRHLGEKIDKGGPWGSSDLIREQSLDYFLTQLRSSTDFETGYSYGGNHSASAYLESVCPDSQFICPESTLFRSNSFADTKASKLKISRRVSIEDRPYIGRALVKRIMVDNKWVICSQQKTSRALSGAKTERSYILRSDCAIYAHYKRKNFISKLAEIKKAAKAIVDHPYIYEDLPKMEAPSRLWKPSYLRRATNAEVASFFGVWPIHTAAFAGGLVDLLEKQPQPQVGLIKELDDLQADILSEVPAEMKKMSPIAPALVSMLARVLLCTIETPDKQALSTSLNLTSSPS